MKEMIEKTINLDEPEAPELMHRANRVKVEGWNDEVLCLILANDHAPRGQKSKEALLGKCEVRVLIDTLQEALG